MTDFATLLHTPADVRAHHARARAEALVERIAAGADRKVLSLMALCLVDELAVLADELDPVAKVLDATNAGPNVIPFPKLSTRA